MDDKLYTITLSLIGFGFGGLVFWRIFKALFLLYKNRCSNEGDKESCPYYCKVLEAGMDKELCGTMLERRNELWQQFGQIAIAALVAIILAVLLLTKTVDAVAGLPLLSVIGGFSLAKTAGTKENRTILPGEKKTGQD
jgi:hypothetical protein